MLVIPVRANPVRKRKVANMMKVLEKALAALNTIDKM